MIKQLYYDYFSYPNKNNEDYFKIKMSRKGKTIIQHPSLGFDTRVGAGYGRELLDLGDQIFENRIFHQKIRYDSGDCKPLVNRFIQESINHAFLRKDEILWYDTGFWTITRKQESFIGIGPNAFERTISKLGFGEAAFSLVNRDSIVIIKCGFKNGIFHEKAFFDIYATNVFLPYVEVVQPFREALNAMGRNITVKEEFKYEKDISKYFESEKTFLLRPSALVNTKLGPFFAVVKNPFISANVKDLKSLNYVMGDTPGSFLESDFHGKGRFRIQADVWILENVLVVDFSFRQVLSRGEIPMFDFLMNNIPQIKLHRVSQHRLGRKSRIPQ